MLLEKIQLPEVTLFNNSIKEYFICLLFFILCSLLIFIFGKLFFTNVKKLTKQTENEFDDLLVENIEKNLLPLIYLAAFRLCTGNLQIIHSYKKEVNAFIALIVTFYSIQFLSITITNMLEIYLAKDRRDIVREKSLKGLIVFLKAVIWSAGFIFLLDNIGFKISTIIAGLGVGGIAVALAAQAILGDFFSYISILFDKPFEVGDFIVIDNIQGTVEHIGIKTTRLTSINGEQIVIANSDLTKSRIQNFKRMEKRRALFRFGVEYETGSEKLRTIPSILDKVISQTNGAIFERAHFASYGNSSLDFEAVYYIEGNDYKHYMDLQQKINLQIFEEFEKQGIKFASPSKPVYLNKS